MLRGLPASVLLHACVFGAGYIVLPYANDPVQVVEIVPVDIVTISEVNNVKTVVERRTELPPTEEPLVEPEPEEPVEEERPEDLELPPEETVPVEEDAVPPPPEKVEEAAPEDVVPEEPEDKEPEPEKKPEPEPKPKDDKPKRDALDDLLDSDLFSAETPILTDKAAKAAPTPTPPPLPDPPAEPPKEPTSQRAQRGVGERTANEARVESLLWAQMRVCWSDLVDLPDPERLAVTVRVNLNRDGTLDGDAELISPRRARIGDRFMQQAIDRALRAARTCAPYQLPEDDYDVWNEITLNFRTDR